MSADAEAPEERFAPGSVQRGEASSSSRQLPYVVDMSTIRKPKATNARSGGGLR